MRAHSSKCTSRTSSLALERLYLQPSGRGPSTSSVGVVTAGRESFGLACSKPGHGSPGSCCHESDSRRTEHLAKSWRASAPTDWHLLLERHPDVRNPTILLGRKFKLRPRATKTKRGPETKGPLLLTSTEPHPQAPHHLRWGHGGRSRARRPRRMLGHRNSSGRLRRRAPARRAHAVLRMVRWGSSPGLWCCREPGR
jgi:hypothetical protein